MEFYDEMSPVCLEFIINHVFLPPKLPQSSEDDVGERNAMLLKLLLEAAEDFVRDAAAPADSHIEKTWRSVVKMLESLCQLENTESLAFRGAIEEMMEGEILVLHMGPQNAGIIIRNLGNRFLFEAFEASPRNSSIVNTSGRLVASFPGPAIEVDANRIRDPAFLTELTSFLEKMKRDIPAISYEVTTKAQEVIPEERETSHPKLITQLLVGILRAVGRPADVEHIKKHLADQVLWDNARGPWRRSALWLVVRVALQTTLRRATGSDDEYKTFMIWFMGQILKRAIRGGLPSELLFVMNAKVSRRVHKAGTSLPDRVLQNARLVGSIADKILRERWTVAQRLDKRPYEWDASTLNYEADTKLTIYESAAHLASVQNTQDLAPERGQFAPEENPRVNVRQEIFPILNTGKMNSTEQNLSLADFEHWVCEHLDSWLHSNAGDLSAYADLGNRIEEYISIAKPVYAGDPVRTSILILTAMELWVALDKIAVQHCPLVGDYCPQFGEGLLQPLLLPRAYQLARLEKVECYLQERQDDSSHIDVPIFSDTTSSRTFAIRYFMTSQRHKELERQILRQAEELRRRKVLEYETQLHAYETKLNVAQGMDCDYINVRRSEGQRQHDKRCRRCRLIREATRMQIKVHEWPLPREEFQRHTAVFELECPLEYSVWRDVTYRILNDICSSIPAAASATAPTAYLHTFGGLQTYFQKPSSRRAQKLVWASRSKSFVGSHYKCRRFPANKQQICVANGLTYGMFDASGRCWMVDSRIKLDVRTVCTFRLPAGPYRALQYALRSTTHAPNQVIADQCECPPELQIHEYVAFGCLRAGHRLQWRNILRELRCRSLTFGSEEVKMLLTQCAWQAGPRDPSAKCREHHLDLTDVNFAQSLLVELEDMLSSIEMNWREAIAAHSLVILAVQLLTVCEPAGASIVQRCVEFLRRARTVALMWMREVLLKLEGCKTEETHGLQERVIQMSAICRSTYSVEPVHLPMVMIFEEDIAVFVECAIAIQRNSLANVERLSAGTRSLFELDRRLSFAIEPYLQPLIVERGVGIDLRPVWSSYTPGASWSRLNYPNNRWLTTTSLPSDGSKQSVHYNLLDGTLIVDGLPLGHMPLNYTSHPTYMELFPGKTMEVFPSSMSGMIFQAKDLIEGHKVGFALSNGDLTIRAKKGSEIYQFIPRKWLIRDLPAHIVKNHLHWMNLKTRDIELRDSRDPWTDKIPQRWFISYVNKTLNLGPDVQLLDVRSPTTIAISNILAPLEYPDWLVVKYERRNERFPTYTPRVMAHLPRLKLDFYVTFSGGLKCLQFPGMVVDFDQTAGTLIGLRNKLIVRQGTTRGILIPYGRISMDVSDNNERAEIEIHTRDCEWVKYHHFTIDTILGRLVGNGSLNSHLFKIYLHAITAHCLPDPLTGRTGTEEALIGLQSAATKSFQALDSRSIAADLLRLIADLTPARNYYPTHMKFMEQIKWNNLSALSQHEQFFTLVQGVFDHARSFHLFDEALQESGMTVNYLQRKSENELSHRAAIRNARYYTAEFGGIAVQKSKDCIYASRDVKGQEVKVCHIARLVDSCAVNMQVHRDLLSLFEEWGTIPGIVQADDEYTFSYDSRWLEKERLKEYWFIHQRTLLRADPTIDKYKIMFLLCTFAMSEIDLNIVRTLLAFATVPELKGLDEPPSFTECNIGEGFAPDIEVLRDVAKMDEVDNAGFQIGGGNFVLRLDKQLVKRQKESTKESEELIRELLSQWPCQEPTVNDAAAYPTLNVPLIVSGAAPYFRNWYRNLALRIHVLQLQGILDYIYVKESPPSLNPENYVFVPCGGDANAKPRNPLTLEHLLKRAPPALPRAPETLMSFLVPTNRKTRHNTMWDLRHVVKCLLQGKNEVTRQEYREDLVRSLNALKDEPGEWVAGPAIEFTPVLERHQKECRDHLTKVWASIEHTLSPKGLGGDLMLYKAGLWPRITPMALLQLLATNQPTEVPHKWKRALVSYGLAITMLQRASRLLKYAKDPKFNPTMLTAEFKKELQNVGHQGWDPAAYPDWLLMEVENNFLVRRIQASIATRMIRPEKNQNSVMQLCMGEGKTNVIVPIACSVLADGDKLVRVVVLKPLSVQMFQTLVRKLGGLVGRQVYYMPFSRSIKVGIKEANKIQALFQECLRNKGILLVLPEHILSFKLLGLERLYNTRHPIPRRANHTQGSDSEVARILLGTQAWLNDTSRDLLDECDEILNSKHELIYSIGSAAAINNAPDRWFVIQGTLDLLHEHISDYVGNNHFDIAHRADPGQFRSIRILKLSSGQRFLKEMAKRVIQDGLPIISFRHFPRKIRSLALRFITDPKISELESRPLLSYCGQSGSELSTGNLYLLRGLFAKGVLLFSLYEKRWKVDYGLDPKRTMLAVPYRAKDFPSNRSEFSHPDVAITLTCLSYYYGGLTEKQLETCFRNLNKSDNPTMEYERWLRGVRLEGLKVHHLSGVNLDDRSQWAKLYEALRRNKAAVDFYLSSVVFPKEAKEYPNKLSSSGWDLAETKNHPTTGFSGTNDNRYLLPLSIEQIDTPEQLSTNARVLANLLNSKNTYAAITHDTGSDLQDILETLCETKTDSRVRVIIDVGAQILGLRNREVVQEWLSHVTGRYEAEAGVFFNESDELTVITRDGLEEPLMVSSFADKLETCLIYLDEAHTRGTDLKLPSRVRAAVTLGPGLTKDRLVQACMRMRKLGDEHTIVFLGPREVHRKLETMVTHEGGDGSIRARDVILWCMIRSCNLTRKLTPIWAKQGLSYQDRSVAWVNIMKNRNVRFPDDLLEPEAKSLRDYYGFEESRLTLLAKTNAKANHPRSRQLQDIATRCRKIDVKSFDGASFLDEQEREQERELYHEVETERENERPGKAGAALHVLTEDVEGLVRTGEVPRGCHSIVPAFSGLTKALGNQRHHKNCWSSNLMATQDFVRTVDLTRGRKIKDYFRPVNWLLSSRSNSSLIVLLSSYEVNNLLPRIRDSTKVVLHMYSPRIRKASPSYEDMRFCTIPPISNDPKWTPPPISLVDQLNIFSGQLYFEDMRAYERVCRFLGLHLDAMSESNETPVESDGFVRKEHREALGMGRSESPFTVSPVAFLGALLSARRKGQNFLMTHMGQVLHGKRLIKEDFED